MDKQGANPQEERLSKEGLCKGDIYYLRCDADVRDADIFSRTGLEKESLGHPVVVIDTLGPINRYLYIMLVCLLWKAERPISNFVS